ncbi:hypothetical protein Poly41_19800 [Novipirellula artificiosorum]|uniref:Uncharacterized protein n=1 Tax=Novipirellula artificiosorum TaxID=2528016 RepID=A0A5C6DWX8_9BACT|nr:hypothetical protein Poly41_19800 [Novipirellula artificiosorum]
MPVCDRVAVGYARDVSFPGVFASLSPPATFLDHVVVLCADFKRRATVFDHFVVRCVVGGCGLTTQWRYVGSYWMPARSSILMSSSRKDRF